MKEECKYIGIVYAGFPSPAADYREEEIDLIKHLRPNSTSIFLARVKGDSMIGANIPDNSIIVIDKARTVKQGSIIIATVNGENVIKHFIKTQTGRFLTPNNPSHKSIKITDDMDFSIWGVVTTVIIDLVK